MHTGRPRLFRGHGWVTLLAVLLITAIACEGGWNFEMPEIQATLQPPGSSNGTPVATPSMIQSAASPAPVGSPIIPLTSGQNQEIVSSDFLNQLYQTVSPGVVSISVVVSQDGQNGQGAGSGFVFDEAGHIVTNNHVVEGSNLVVVTFHDGSESRAEIVGTDPYSDLAVIRVEQLPESVTPLPVGDSSTIVTGDWVVAIGNPFGLNSSMSLGIVSAVGRTIPTGTSFSIPEVIQTDAAINPGNSGGPLLNLQGQVIGVNAQIASGGAMANAGVGFSIPANTVRRVVPVLIEAGVFQWPWLGIEGADVNLFIGQANQVPAGKGAYIVNVVPGGPADQAGLQGGTEVVNIDGVEVPTGGDIVIAANGEPVEDYAELQAIIASQTPGSNMDLTIVRNGEQQQIIATLGPRP